MNRRIVIYMVGQIMRLESALLLLPMAVAITYREFHGIAAFGFTAAVAFLIGMTLIGMTKKHDKVMFAREGFSIVTLAWILLSLVGALPFYLSGEIPNFCNAFFETVSGFTTTGASILDNVEVMSKGMLFWRSFTHWIGGMGILVLMMAIIPTESGRSMHMMRAEMPGPVVGKLVPKIRDTAKILYIIYLVLTAIEFVFLLIGGMPVFDSLVHTLGTAGTGGFGIKADSIASYSPYLQWVIAVFMVVFSVNFNLFYLLLLKRFELVLKNTELWFFITVIAISTLMISFSIMPIYGNYGDSLRYSFFQVSSVISTTGYSTADFNMWPSLAKNILFILMFVGGCAGSTAGGIKISRIIIMLKAVYNNIKQQYHSRSVSTVSIDGKALDQMTLSRVTNYFIVYMLLNVAVFLLISFEQWDFETNLTATVSCINNVGPGFSKVGPAGSYSGYSDFSTIVLSLAMLFGRLEIFPILLAINPGNWIRPRKLR